LRWLVLWSSHWESPKVGYLHQALGDMSLYFIQISKEARLPTEPR
jgi:hypothetical protein